MKQRAVIFNKYGARIIVGNVDAYKNGDNVVVNPNLEKVRGLPPHYWKLVNGEVVPKNELEREATDSLHKQKPFNSLQVQILKKSPSKMYALTYMLMGAAISELIRLAIMNLP